MTLLNRTSGSQGRNSNATVARWLDERRLLLVRLMATARAVNSPQDYGRELAGLCEVLVDYTSAGHFGVYALLLPVDRADAALTEAYRRIDQTTEAVLRFNEFAEALETVVERREALSHLSLALEERFELEDSLAVAGARAPAAAAAMPGPEHAIAAG